MIPIKIHTRLFLLLLCLVNFVQAENDSIIPAIGFIEPIYTNESEKKPRRIITLVPKDVTPEVVSTYYKEKCFLELMRMAKNNKSMVLTFLKNLPKDEIKSDALIAAACYAQELDIVSMLLAKGASAQAKDDYGNPILGVAVLYNSLPLAKLLLKHGANPNTALKVSVRFPDELSLSSAPLLHVAVVGQMRDMTILLLQYGGNEFINSLTTFDDGSLGGILAQRAPLHFVCSEVSDTPEDEQSDIKVIKLLLSHGANVNVQDSIGHTSLHCAAQANKLAVAKLLVQSGVDITLINAYGDSALDYAVLGNAPGIVDVLMSKNKNLFQAECAFANAVFADNVSIAKIFIKYGVKGTCTDCGNTLLHVVASRNNIELAKLLLNLGLDPKAKNDNGFTPLDIAQRKKATKIAELLSEQVSKPKKSLLSYFGL